MEELSIEVGKTTGSVSGLLLRPDGADWLYVFGHGAGAGMGHKSMHAIAESLADVGIATLRYNFPYMEHGGGLNPKPVLYATVRAAIRAGAEYGLPMLAGGKSMGGRMTSNALAENGDDNASPSIEGLVFYGFPLHPSGKPGVERADHLRQVTAPMLFLQGTRDTLAELDLLNPIVEEIGATMHVIDDADHSFHVRKSSGQTDEGVLIELASTVRNWADDLCQTNH